MRQEKREISGYTPKVRKVNKAQSTGPFRSPISVDNKKKISFCCK